MTLKNLYFKLVKQETKQKIWCPILVFISLFVILEVQLIMVLQDMERWPKSYAYSIPHYFANEFLTPDGNVFFTIATVVTAIVCAMAVFSYVHSRQKLDTYHSLPASRTTLFLSRYITGVLLYLVPCIGHLVICAVIASGKGAMSIHGVKSLLGLLGTEFIIFLLCYSMTIICIMLTGNFIISVLATIILQSYSLLLWGLKIILYDKFYYTAIADYIGPVWAFSPFQMIYKLFEIAAEYRLDNIGFSYQAMVGYLMVMVVATVFFLAVGLFLYQKRPTEAAGRTIAFGITEPVIKCMIVIPFSLLAGFFFTVVSSGNSFAWYLFGIMFGFILCCLFVEIVFRKDIKAAFCHWQQMVFNGACIALLILVFKNDAMGYNSYVPAREEVDNFSVVIEGLLDDNASYYTNYMYGYQMEHMELRENESVLLLAEKLASEGLRYQEFDYYEGLYDTPEYKERAAKEENYRGITFGYHLNNGKTICRRYFYDMTDEESKQLVGNIFNDADYKLGSMPVFTNGWNKEIKAVICRGNFAWQTIVMTQPQQNRLMELYQSEFIKLTFEEVLQDVPIGTLDFEFKRDTAVKGGTREYNSYYANGYKIYPQFVKTIALLKEYGFDVLETLTCENIQKITITDYKYEYDYNMFQQAPTVEYKEEAQMQEIVDCLVNRELINSFEYMPVDSKYDVMVTYIMPDGTKDSRYFVFKKNQMPDFVEEDMEAQRQTYVLTDNEVADNF